MTRRSFRWVDHLCLLYFITCQFYLKDVYNYSPSFHYTSSFLTAFFSLDLRASYRIYWIFFSSSCDDDIPLLDSIFCWFYLLHPTFTCKLCVILYRGDNRFRSQTFFMYFVLAASAFFVSLDTLSYCTCFEFGHQFNPIWPPTRQKWPDRSVCDRIPASAH